LVAYAVQIFRVFRVFRVFRGKKMSWLLWINHLGCLDAAIFDPWPSAFALFSWYNHLGEKKAPKAFIFGSRMMPKSE